MAYGTTLRDMQFDTIPVDVFGVRNQQFGNDPGYVHFMPYTSFVPDDAVGVINNNGETNVSYVQRNPLQQLTDAWGLTSVTGLPTDFKFPTSSLSLILIGIVGIIAIKKL